MTRAALAGLVALLAIAVVGCTGDDDPPDVVATAEAETPTAEATPTDASATPVATAGVTEPPTPSTSPTPEPLPPELELEGVFSDPRRRPPDTERSLPPRPESPFPEQPLRRTVLYDTLTGETRDLGPGNAGCFSPDGAYMDWTSFGDDSRAAGSYRLELETGVIAPIADLPEACPDPRRSEPPAFETTSEMLADGGWRSTISRASSGELMLWFEEPLALVVEHDDELLIGIGSGPGFVNLFVVDLVELTADFVASALRSPQGLPADLGERHIVWMDNLCGPAGVPESTKIYSRETGEITVVDDFLWPRLTPNGLLAPGLSFTFELIDPHTLEYVVVLPPDAGAGTETRWSPDYRYASSDGLVLGRGGPCAG